MNRHLISMLILILIFNNNLFGQTGSKVDSISMMNLHTLDIGFDSFKPFLAENNGKGYILTVGYEFSNKMHLFYRLNVDGGYYGSIYEACSYKKFVQDYYGIGLIPEIKCYPIKRHRDTYGFYVTAYTGAKLIYKKDSYFENEELNWQNNNWGVLFWYAGLGLGYKIHVYKGLFIEPTHGFSIGDQTFDYFNFCDKGMFEFIDGLQYLILHTRLQLKIGYNFNL